MRIGINTSMNTVFFLARHGETQWNKLKKLQKILGNYFSRKTKKITFFV